MSMCQLFLLLQDGWGGLSVQDLEIPLGDAAPPHLGLHELLLLAAMAFFAGSIPFGLWISKAFGIDIRHHGSGNIGATNVGRVLGRRMGTLCFLLDMIKGFAPTFYAGLYMNLVPGLFFAQPVNPPHWAWWWLIIMALPILGHMYSPWVGFKGGKGVATGLGTLLGVFPYLAIPAVGAIAIWMSVVALTRYVSLASVLAAVSLPVLVIVWAWISMVAVEQERAFVLQALREQGIGLVPFYVVTGVMAGIVVWKHRDNIKRLWRGNERRLGERVRVSSSPQM